MSRERLPNNIMETKTQKPSAQRGPQALVGSGRLVRPLRIARIRAGLYNYRGYNLYRTKREWVILGEDNEAYEYGPTRAALVELIDRWERRPNSHG